MTKEQMTRLMAMLDELYIRYSYHEIRDHNGKIVGYNLYIFEDELECSVKEDNSDE